MYIWFAVRIYVTVNLTIYGLGSYKTRTDLQGSLILLVVFVYDRALPIIYMEKGKTRKMKYNIKLSTILYLIQTPIWKPFVILVWGGCDWRYRGISDHSRNHHSRLEGRCNDCVSCSSTWYHGSWVHTREGRLFSSFWSSFTCLVYISSGILDKYFTFFGTFINIVAHIIRSST